MNTQIFPRGDRLPEGMFTGAAYMHPLEDNDLLNAGAVTFEPGLGTTGTPIPWPSSSS